MQLKISIWILNKFLWITEFYMQNLSKNLLFSESLIFLPNSEKTLNIENVALSSFNQKQ